MKIVIPNKTLSKDNKVTVKLFMQFAKMNDIKMDILYENAETFFKLTSKLGVIGDLYLFCGRRFTTYLSMEELILSQLWRFFVYDNLKLYSDDIKDKVRRSLIDNILINGDKGDERLKKLFKKYNLRNGF